MPHRLLVVALVLCALVAPSTAGAQTTIDLVVTDIDAFWAEQFANAGLTYTSPALGSIDGPMTTGCGDIDPYYSPGAYCAADQTVYYSTAWAPNDAAGEILWWAVLSHEWGHHIPWQGAPRVNTVVEAELQADCFAGAYLSHARSIGL